MIRFRIICFILLAVVSTIPGQTRLSELFNGFEGTIALYDARSNSYTVINEERGGTRYSPFSTFKIPNCFEYRREKFYGDPKTQN